MKKRNSICKCMTRFKNLFHKFSKFKYRPLLPQCIVIWFYSFLICLVSGVIWSLAIAEGEGLVVPADYIALGILLTIFGGITLIALMSFNLLVLLFLNYSKIAPNILYSRLMVTIESGLFTCCYFIIDNLTSAWIKSMYVEMALTSVSICVIFVLLRCLFYKKTLIWEYSIDNNSNESGCSKKYLFSKWIDIPVIIAIITFILSFYRNYH